MPGGGYTTTGEAGNQKKPMSGVGIYAQSIRERKKIFEAVNRENDFAEGSRGKSSRRQGLEEVIIGLFKYVLDRNQEDLIW
jgi:hypothetical protein